MMPEKPSIRKRLSKQQADSPISVLMLGIDSISRLNLIRAMPETRTYLKLNKWIEMKGYNKVISFIPLLQLYFVLFRLEIILFQI